MELRQAAKLGSATLVKPDWFIPNIERLLIALAQKESSGGRNLGPRFERHIFERLSTSGQFLHRSKRELETLASSHGAWQLMGYRAIELGFEPVGEIDWIAFGRSNELGAIYAAKYLQRFVLEHTLVKDALTRLFKSPGAEGEQVKAVGHAYNGNPAAIERPMPRVQEYANDLWSIYAGLQ